MNTCKSVSKQTTLTSFRMNTYEKQGESGGRRIAGSFLLSPPYTVRMNASISCMSPQRSGFFGIPAMPGPTLYFSALMTDDAKTIARGAQKRDPAQLARLSQ